MEEILSLKAYGVLGYSMALSLALAAVSVGVAYLRARRDRLRSIMLIVSASLFAVLFGYLILVSLETGWLDRKVMQPIIRTATIGAAGAGWIFMILWLRTEANVNAFMRRQLDDLEEVYRVDNSQSGLA